jgi:uncharacterized protein with ParB-like and HNH nuclease domain
VVIIPDLQRDYCWGTIINDKELVRYFVKNIIDNGFLTSSDLKLGLIYGYETPIGHIQLCDGQQRITTLFLLLGLINKKSNNVFKSQLISQFELEKDDKEPYLQYSIRESSLYFLSDLVCNFFIAENEFKVSDIKSQLWYFRDYDLDPSIQSMLNALLIIEDEIKHINDPISFGNYLVTRLSFLYYDMVNRANGEETFVIINTTGEPLTLTENLKPLFINAQKAENQENCSKVWEEWETWFWKMRKGSGKKENDTADNGFREFLRWITLLKTTEINDFKKIQESGHFDFNIKLEVEEIDRYFNIVRFLFEDSDIFMDNLDWLAPDKKDKNINSQITWFQLLPVIEYVNLYGKEDYRNIIRAKRFFENLSKIENISKAVGLLLPKAIEIINSMKHGDIAEIKNLPEVSSQILTEEEKRKFDIYLTNPEERTKFEDAFWSAENHTIWRGEILPLLNWSTINDKFDFNKFVSFDDVFCHLFHDNLEYTELDITRRALLTRNLKEYPRTFRGYTNVSFCKENTDWQVLIKDNSEKFGEFLNELISASNIEEVLQTMIHEYLPEKEWFDFVKIPELLKYCTQKNIQKTDKGWLLVRGIKTSGEYANLKTYKLYLEFKSTPFWDTALWIINFYSNEGSCAYFDNIQKNIAINVINCFEDDYKIQVFRRNLPEEDIKNDLMNLVNSIDLEWNGERYESKPQNKENIINLIKNVMMY